MNDRLSVNCLPENIGYGILRCKEHGGTMQEPTDRCHKAIELPNRDSSVEPNDVLDKLIDLEILAANGPTRAGWPVKWDAIQSVASKAIDEIVRLRKRVAAIEQPNSLIPPTGARYDAMETAQTQSYKTTVQHEACRSDIRIHR